MISPTAVDFACTPVNSSEEKGENIVKLMKRKKLQYDSDQLPEKFLVLVAVVATVAVVADSFYGNSVERRAVTMALI